MTQGVEVGCPLPGFGTHVQIKYRVPLHSDNLIDSKESISMNVTEDEKAATDVSELEKRLYVLLLAMVTIRFRGRSRQT